MVLTKTKTRNEIKMCYHICDQTHSWVCVCAKYQRETYWSAHWNTCNTLPDPSVASVGPPQLKTTQFQKFTYARCYVQCYSAHYVIKVLILWLHQRHFLSLCTHNMRKYTQSICITEHAQTHTHNKSATSTVGLYITVSFSSLTFNKFNPKIFSGVIL